MKPHEYARADGLGLAKLVRAKEVKPLELVDAAIGMIEARNPKLNAVVWTMFDRARDMARKKLPDGPFKGVPFLLKDILGGMAGVPTRQGSRLIPDIPDAHNAELTERFLAGGLIPLGKTNVPEFGLVGTTESQLYGPARNPWNPDHSAGGSSGGSGAAVASGMVPVAHANDGGGSIRIPASCNGLVGLKPTRARNPLGPDLGDIMGGLVCEHIVSKSVRDTAAMLDVTAGPGIGDPYCAPPGPNGWLAAARKKPHRLRIAIARTRLDGDALHPDCVAAVDHAAALCKALGHKVTQASPPVSPAEMVEPFMALWTGGLALQVDALQQMTGAKPGLKTLEGLTLGLYEAGKQVSAVQYAGAIHALQQIGRRVAHWHKDYDVWITPTLGLPPIPIGLFDGSVRDVREGFAPMVNYVPFTALQNGTGQPAINLPLFWNSGGLPIGTQFVGRFGEEVTLLRLAFQLEKADPWKARYKSIH